LAHLFASTSCWHLSDTLVNFITNSVVPLNLWDLKIWLNRLLLILWVLEKSGKILSSSNILSFQKWTEIFVLKCIFDLANVRLVLDFYANQQSSIRTHINSVLAWQYKYIANCFPFNSILLSVICCCGHSRVNCSHLLSHSDISFFRMSHCAFVLASGIKLKTSCVDVFRNLSGRVSEYSVSRTFAHAVKLK